MATEISSYDPNTGIYSYKKDGQWFFSVCPPDQVKSRRVDGKWYFVEMCVGGSGDGSGVNLAPYAKTVDVDAKDQATLTSAKEYTDEQIAGIEVIIPDEYATEEWVTQQIEAIELPEGGAAFDGDMKGERITNVGNAVENDDAVSKAVCKGWDMYTLDAAKEYTDEEVAKIEIPSVEGLASQEWVLDQSYITEQPVTDGDEATLKSAKEYTDEEIAKIEIPSVDGLASQEWVLDQSYITEQPVTDGDEATLKSAKEYTDEQIAAIEFPEGADLDKYAETTYVDSAIQAVTTETDQKLNDGLSGKVGNTGTQDLPTTTWKIRAKKTADDGGNYSYIAIEGDKLKLYHVADPTSDEHALSRGYGDGRYQIKQVPIVFKCDQYAACVSNQNAPPSGSFCGLYNTAPGSSTNANPYFGNFNSDIRIHIDKLKNPEGETFQKNERYLLNGTVTIFDKVGKLYFKHAITSVGRDTHDYVTLHFASRVPAFGTGGVADSTQYAVIVEGVMNKAVDTTNIPEEE